MEMGQCRLMQAVTKDCLQQRQREGHVVGMTSEWVCEYSRARYIMVMFVVKSVMNLVPGNDLPAPLG